MDALTLLKSDHDKVKRLLGELGSTTEVRERERLFQTIKGEMTVHELIEEEIFYPELQAHPKAKDEVLEGYEEHHVVDTVMGDLDGMTPDDDRWAPTAKVMKENIEHHIGEEEDAMFEAARQIFDDTELDEMGERMQARKTEAMRELGIAP